MLMPSGPGTVRVLRRPIVLVGTFIVLTGSLTGCSQSGGTTVEPPDASGVVWLCRPGLPHDPCSASLETTVVEQNGSKHIVDYRPARNPPVDCFFVYPNITHQQSDNANLDIDPQETSIAELEASPFSQVCRVFAPIYREDTGDATGSAAEGSASRIAYDSVVGAWNDYLAHYNDGRGVVLIGHSEGSYWLAQLLGQHIDQLPRVRSLLVSAIITGANLPVYKTGFGPLKTIGPCQSSTQTGCVIDYNAFTGPPPSDSIFGKPPQPEFNGHAVEDVCNNPASLDGTEGRVISMYRTQLPTQEVAGSTTEGIFGSRPPTSTTPWIEYDGFISARCVLKDGLNYLLVEPDESDGPHLTATPTPAWGLHVDDPNLEMGNLIQLVRSETGSYVDSHPSAPSS
jgi:hypothetical protein